MAQKSGFIIGCTMVLIKLIKNWSMGGRGSEVGSQKHNYAFIMLIPIK